MAASQTNIGVNAGGDINAHKIKVVQNITPVDPPPKNIRFKVDKPIQTFTGRETFLEELHKVVKEGREGGQGGVTVLTQEPLPVVAATGGIGKTETVRRYIQLHGHEYDHIIWIDAEDNSFAQRQFLQLAMELEIPTDFEGKQKEFESILKEIFGKLLLNAHVVLLVFDNAEAMDDDEELSLSGIRSLRPTSLSPFFVEPTIIVTSRKQNWSHQKVIQLDLWTEAEVIIFVTVQLNLEKKSESTTLVLQLGNLFGRLPIALQAAVAVILQQIKRGKKYGIQSLIDEYESGSRKVLTQKPSDANKRKNKGDTMLVLWNISLEKIVRYEDGELAIKLLCFMAYMSQTRIPRDFIFALCKNSCTEDSFENALEILGDYSLIASLNSNDSDSRSFSIHRMIQDSTIENLRERTNEEQTPNAIFNDKTFLNVTEVLLKLSTESLNYLETFTELTFSRSGDLVEHLVQITNHLSKKLDEEKFRDFTKKTAWVLGITNNFTKSIELLERVLKATPIPHKMIEMPKLLLLLQALADAYREGGHGQKSINCNLLTLEIFTLVFGPDHELTLDEKCKVAHAFSEGGRDHEATKMRQEALQGYENNEHTQGALYLQLKAIYACGLIDKEERRVAMELLGETLKKQGKVTDSNSRRIKVTQLGIAAVLRRKDHFDEIKKLILQEIEDDTKRFGPSGMTTLSMRVSYALTLHAEGKHDLAAPLLLELLETYENQFGSYHPSALKTKVKFARVYLATKELDQAEALLDVEVLERVFGPENPTTLEAASLLSKVKKEQGKFEDALALLKKVLEVRKKILGPHHKDTLNTMHTICKLYYGMGECQKAASFLRKLLETKEIQLGSNHPSILTAKFGLAQFYLKTKELDKAEALLDVEAMEKVFGPKHIETMSTVIVLSDLKEQQGKFRDALALQKKVLKVRKNVIAPNHKDALSTMHTIGKLYYKMEEYEKAVTVAQELLDRQEKSIGKDHPDAIITLKFLTSCRELFDYRNNFTMAFMTLTSVDAKTAKSFSKALNWNLEAVLKAYRSSNPNALVADQDHALTFGLGTLTAAENQNILIIKFMAVTGVNTETGKSWLQASDWNMEVALVSFFDSSSGEDDSNIDMQDALILSASATDAEKQNELIPNFMAVTKVDTEIGKICLQASDWNLEVALEAFCESRLDEDIADIELQDDAMIPSLTTAGTENEKVATTFYNEMEVNKIQDVEVQVESVAESNQPTTSILFFPTAYSADPDKASTPKLETSTCAKIQNLFKTILSFMAVTRVNAEIGKFFLQASDWNLEVALEAFFQSNPNNDTADLYLQHEAFIPSAVATAAENLNVATASCNKTEVNQIQGVEVQVETVAESYQPTKSILFCLAGEKRFRGQFGVSSTVNDLYKFVNEKRPDLADSHYVLTLYPNIQLSKMEKTLKEAKIPKNVALTLKMLKQ